MIWTRPFKSVSVYIAPTGWANSPPGLATALLYQRSVMTELIIPQKDCAAFPFAVHPHSDEEE
jgi:hypothetical protein